MSGGLGDLRWVCFDVGEVLVDETRVWSVWAQLAGVSALTLHAALGAALAAGRSHVAVLDELVGDWRQRLDEHEARYGGFTEDDLYADVRESLGALRERGIQVAIAGNQPARRSAQLAALELPAQVIATSADLGARKPDAAFFSGVLDACSEDEPQRVLYVGDRRDNDVAAAAAYGVRTAWLRRGPWALLQPEPMEQSEPDVVASTLHDIVHAVDGEHSHG